MNLQRHCSLAAQGGASRVGEPADMTGRGHGTVLASGKSEME